VIVAVTPQVPRIADVNITPFRKIIDLDRLLDAKHNQPRLIQAIVNLAPIFGRWPSRDHQHGPSIKRVVQRRCWLVLSAERLLEGSDNAAGFAAAHKLIPCIKSSHAASGPPRQQHFAPANKDLPFAPRLEYVAVDIETQVQVITRLDQQLSAVMETMMSFEILDCTLRDGGYYTNWDFDEDLVETYFTDVARLPIVALEVGYCNDPKPGYRGEWCYLGKARLEWIKGKLRSDQVLAIMLDAKDVKVERLDAMLGDLTGIVGMVRMAVAPKEFKHGLALARKLKEMGFKVGFNTMYLSTYSDDLAELAPLLEGAELIDTIALVDSFGGCTPTGVHKSIVKAKEMFPNNVIGFHGHDNTCLGYANALAAIEAGADVIDATFVGMGRGAGNTRTEMLLVHKASESDVDIDLEAAAQIVDRFEAMRAQYKWGTNFPYMLSGAGNLPQKDVMDWLGKNRYSPVSVVRALRNQRSGEIDHQDFPDLRPNSLPESARDTVLIVGGGESVVRHRRAIEEYARTRGVCVLHANTRHLDLIGKLGPNELVCLPGHAAMRLPAGIDYSSVLGFVVPEPPRFPGSVPTSLERPVFQAPNYPQDGKDSLGPISDMGPLALAVGAAKALSAREIMLVGFDGYAEATSAEQELAGEIQATIDRVLAEGTPTIASLTPTLYSLPTRSIYAESRVTEAA
jgi:4-hydroxy 2-oxovalerate aldolase